MYRKLFLALKKVQMVKNTLFQIPTTQQKVLPATFPITPTGEKALLLNTISRSMSFQFALKDDFLEKLTNISITFIYMLFSSMLTCFIKNPQSRSWDVRLHNFGGKLHPYFPHATKRDTFWETIFICFWCS